MRVAATAVDAFPLCEKGMRACIRSERRCYLLFDCLRSFFFFLFYFGERESSRLRLSLYGAMVVYIWGRCGRAGLSGILGAKVFFYDGTGGGVGKLGAVRVYF